MSFRSFAYISNCVFFCVISITSVYAQQHTVSAVPSSSPSAEAATPLEQGGIGNTTAQATIPSEDYQRKMGEVDVIMNTVLEQQKQLSERIDTLTRGLSALTTAYTVTTEKRQETVQLMDNLINDNRALQAELSDLSSKVSDINTKARVTGTPIGSEKTQQYLKFKTRDENGKEVELFVDPTYVDMNFNVQEPGSEDTAISPMDAKRSDDKHDVIVLQQPDQRGGIRQRDDIESLMRYIDDSIARSSINRGQQPVVQPVILNTPSPQWNQNQPMQPQQQYPYQQQNPQYQNLYQVVGSSGIAISSTTVRFINIEQTVVDDLYTAQKLYYAKQYYKALTAVQRSLMKQPTALGFAMQGSIYFTLGQRDLAIRSWEAALKLNPDMEEVQTALNKYRIRG